jgi:hypothetical protein
VEVERGGHGTIFGVASSVDIDQSSSYYLLNNAEGKYLEGQIKRVSGDEAKRFVASHGTDFPSCRRAKAGVSW